MKNKGKCSKCESLEVLGIPNKGMAGCLGNAINLGFFSGRIQVTRYLCLKCGFSEDWVENRGDLEDLRSKFLKKKR